MEANLKILISRREYTFRNLQILFDLSKNVREDPTKLRSFRTRYKHIENIRSQYTELTNEINEIQLKLKPESDIGSQAMLAFDEMYYEVAAVADEVSSASDLSRNETVKCGDVEPTVASRTRLPIIELPKFDSNIENWQTFYDTFLTVVHENNLISPVEKYHYLISCLSGYALSIVKGLPVTSDNYKIAFNALIDRFENKRVIAAMYLEKILNFPTISSPSLNELLKVTNMLYESVNALRNMKMDNLGEYILFHLASRALDSDTRKRFEIQNKPTVIPTFSELLKFLQDYVKIIETSEHRSSISSNIKPIAKAPNSKIQVNRNYKSSILTSQNAHTKQTSFTCPCCNLAHSIYKCPKFIAFSSQVKANIVKQKGLCVNCLRYGHVKDSCISKTGCYVCGDRHHTLLHSDTNSAPEPSTPRVAVSSPTRSSVHFGHTRALVLLGTCTLLARAPSGTTQVLRALIDSGAQDCFITTACARRLGLVVRRCEITVAGIGQHTVQHIKGVTSCTIQPRDANDPVFKIEPIVLNTITSTMPAVRLPEAVRSHYNHLKLADENFDKPSNIDLLLGAELFHEIYDGHRFLPEQGLPVAMSSVFGWVLTGKVEPCIRPQLDVTSLVSSTLAIDESVQRFWEVEEPPKYRIITPDDEKCEDIYVKNVRQDSEGRYVLPILLKESHPMLGDTYKLSSKRLYNLEKRLSRQDGLRCDYMKFMQEYEDLHHMQQVKTKSPAGKYFIPHHGVIRPESMTTKLRVVFDASCKSSNGYSLNDIVYKGPKLQADIVDILTKFRLHVVAFSSDISKMYRAILIRPEDRQWQHILWRKSPTDAVSEYELRTVTYGVSSSPYLAIRTLQQLAIDHGAAWPHAAKVLRHDVFMDDILTGAPSVKQALQLQKELIALLKCAKFQLHKWSSNSPEFLETLAFEHLQVCKSFTDEGDKSTLKVLGVQWDPVGDYFTYSASDVGVGCTKRSILSNVARIFDPLGWLTPVTLIAKLLLQDLWRLKLSWDESVPYDLERIWQDFVSELNNLKFIKLQRPIAPTEATEYQLVGFCDGSTKAYGCCVYLRAVAGSNITVSLLIAKSKVAPLKPLTVNRLELCGATLLSRVINHLFTLLRDEINITDQIAFTDSGTVLSWLNTEPYKLKTFVAHRVVQTTDAVPATKWRHVSTLDNPADYCSRGMSCSQLHACDHWWFGPKWLSDELIKWPTSRKPEPQNVYVEIKSSSLLSHASYEKKGDEVMNHFIHRFSSLTRLQRTVAWCIRFVNNAKSLVNARTTGPLKATELTDALDRCIRRVQADHYSREIACIYSNRPCNRTIQKLSPFIDDSKILRVGGRLKYASVSNQGKHPYLLPKNTHLAILIIDHYHIAYLHCGPRTLQSLVQRRFWILGIRNLIRSRLSKCVTCFKAKPLPSQPVMGDLPALRLEQGACFLNIGIDFGGPFLVKESRRRNARLHKAYVCLFVCLSTKAVHLELVTELSTDAFIAALDRFVARRGICRSIITDCGTNFVGAKRYLNEMFKLLSDDKHNIENVLSNRSISWKLNPPGAPHFGGIFESGIKSTKFHLKRVVGNQSLTFEEFSTVLTKIEAILNSRPLCVLSSDPHEVDVLTAGHFLIGRPMASLPEQHFDETNLSLKSRWQMLQRLTQSFWRTWQRDYLHTLQQKVKWFTKQGCDLEEGAVVVILEPNLSTAEWRLGRIEKVFPGKDNQIRVVSVRTAKGTLTRPSRKICPLPISTEPI